MNETSHNIKDRVLEKIRNNEVVMRPKVFFVAKISLVITVAALALLASAFAISFAFFSIHESGELFLLGFGFRGLTTFLALFPWFTFLLAVVLVFLFEWLLRHFKFNYRMPILKTFFGVLGLIIVAGIIIGLTPIHEHFLDASDKDNSLIFSNMYHDIHMPHEEKGEFRGIVVAVGSNSVTITHNDYDSDSDDGTRIVLLPRGLNARDFKIGDRVYVAGTIDKNVITAYGLRKF